MNAASGQSYKEAIVSLVVALLLFAPGVGRALCDVIPQKQDVYRGAMGSANTPFASPNDRVEISLANGAGQCEDGATFAGTAPLSWTYDFEGGTTEGWSALSGQLLSAEPTGGNPDGWLRLTDTPPAGFATITAPAEMLGDWAARGITELRWDHYVDSVGAAPRGAIPLVRLYGGGSQATYTFDASTVPDQIWTTILIPIDVDAPPPGWGVTGSWQTIMADVTQVRIEVELRQNLSDEVYGLDNIALSGTSDRATVATVLYTPPSAVDAALIVSPLAGGCAAEPLASAVAACASALPVGSGVQCIEDPTAIVTADRFSFRFPAQTLVKANFGGPTKLAVTPADEALPCPLATTRCADPGAPANLIACIDELYQNDDTCSTGAASRAKTFSHFTGLPFPTDFAKMCSSADPSSPCEGTEPDLHIAIDADGNALVPIYWSRVLVPGRLPIPRIVAGTTVLEGFDSDATPGTDPPISIPGPSFLSSYSPRGNRVPPIFTPVGDPSDASGLLGSVDAPRGVMRIARRSERLRECSGGARDGLACNVDTECPSGACEPGTCQGGGNLGSPCTSDLQCPGSECGPSIFDLSDRAPLGVVTVPGSDYAAEARNPVAIDALLETQDMLVTVRSEPLEGASGEDLNGDSDVVDTSVVSIRNKADDSEIMFGLGGSVGSAIARTDAYPFTVPAVAAEGDLAVVLAPEAWNDSTPANADGDLADYVVQVLRVLPGGGFEQLNDTAVGDPSLAIDGHSVTISGGNVFWREPEGARAPNVVVDLDVSAGGTPGDDTYAVELDGVSDDGRFVVFDSPATNLVAGGSDTGLDVFLHDRDVDADGVFDEAGAIDTFQVSLLPGGADPSGSSREPTISANGRFVVFESNSALTGQGTGGNHIFLYDRDVDEDGLFDEPGQTAMKLMTIFDTGVPFANDPGNPVIRPDVSDDGRFVVWRQGVDPSTGTTNGGTFKARIAIHDRDADEDGIFDDEGDGYDPGEIEVHFVQGASPPDIFSANGVISGDGAWVAFESEATNLSPVPDTNARQDIYMVGTAPGAVPFRISTTEAGGELNHVTQAPAISRTGRFVVMTTQATNLVSYREGDATTGFIRDRDPDEDGVFDEPGEIRNIRIDRGDYIHGWSSFDHEGRFVSLSLARFNPNLANWGLFDARTGVFAPLLTADVVGSAVRRLGADRTGRTHYAKELGGGGHIVAQGPDLDPGSPGNAGNDLNADGDLLDTVLRVLDGTAPGPPPIAPTALGPATLVATADGIAAFLVPEAQVGPGTDLDGDGFPDDEVVHLWTVGAPTNLGQAASALALSSDYLAVIEPGTNDVLVTPVVGAPSWTSLGVDAKEVKVAGSLIAVLDYINPDLETVLVVYDAATSTWVLDEATAVANRYTAVDVALSEEAVAFRVSEPAGKTIWNEDGDPADEVMLVLDPATGTVHNTKFAAIACPVEACDPTRPYSVKGKRVRFLTRETDQAGSTIGCDPNFLAGCDLDGNGLGTDLILQHFNLEAAAMGMAGDDATQTVARTTTGICTDTGEACTDTSQCPLGECFVPPGGCLRDLAVFCNPDGIAAVCGAGEFCVPDFGVTGSGSCHVIEGPCSSDGQCTAPAFCTDVQAGVVRVFSAVNGDTDGSSEVVLSYGKCLADTGPACTENVDCSPGQICQEGSCSDVGLFCRDDAACDPGFTCAREAIATGSADSDGDGLADAIDNAPFVPNSDQMDSDGDGIGDAGDRQTCGDGIQSYGETCDDGNTTPGDGCDDLCQLEGATPACSNGLDDDGDGLIDDPSDPGCDSPADTSERDPSLPCDDGEDNDGDYRSDYLGDPGCMLPTSPSESPECDDGLDNDGDGFTDATGPSPDPECGGVGWHDDEATPVPEPGVGLGLVAGGIGLALLARRRRGSKRRMRRVRAA